MATDEKKTYDQLRQELADAATIVEVGATYAHYKHPELPYLIKGFAIWEVTDEVAVLYEPVHEPQVTFVRPLQVWLETVEWNGKTVPRFARIEH